MELDRKEFHFDLDVDSLKLTYSDHDSSSWNAAWSDIRELLEEHGFEKPQYSGYESADKMSYLEAYHVIDILSDKLPWFSSCVKAATFTEIGESYDVKEFLENGMQLSLPLRPDTRKELHFDLGTAALSENYGSIRPNAWRGAWTLIRNFMERNGFVHTQYSGYESKAAIPIDKALAVMGKLQQRYPWFKDSLLAASLTEVGERHDALSYIKGSSGIIVPVPAHSLGLEELDFFGSEIGDMKSATAELSKRNGLEPPKDLNKAH